ncbi:unnamed protein product [Cylindrotheca closterium]|uniref:DUF6824 domain-containing protein n=1 Tax=Cylindrotheca closterium TaxID=2856 RepID=A0AAD2GA24_9STRA|nr:unnamed protein product [Cylindrotheca closterium]
MNDRSSHDPPGLLQSNSTPTDEVRQISRSVADALHKMPSAMEDERLPSNFPPQHASTPSRRFTSKTTDDRDKVSPSISAPTDPVANDVLFGKGRKKHPGNKMLREVMDNLEQQYEEASKQRKMELTCVIVQSMKWSGSRFLVQEDDGQWYQVPYIHAHRKVAKDFRNRRRGSKAQQNQNNSDTSLEVTSLRL